MSVFLLNLVLAGLWAAAVGSVDTAHLVVGFVVGYCALWVARPLLGGTGYFRKVPQAARFAPGMGLAPGQRHPLTWMML